MKNISEILEGIHSVGIGGHVRPDGDCIGASMALYLYLKQEFSHLQVDLYLEHPSETFQYIEAIDEIKETADPTITYDLFILLDVSAQDRIGVAGECFRRARRTCCIDHHVSNQGFADVNEIRGGISSSCEVLYELLDADKIGQSIAIPIYTGIIHDTGVFQYSSTTKRTMEIAGALISTGFNFSRIIDASFYEKTYVQNQVMGRVLTESILLLDGQCIAGVLRHKDLEFYGITGADLDGIVNQLRLTKGVRVAVFIYEFGSLHYKVSLRSDESVDVSKIASFFGGGGHVRAAGCDMNGTHYDVLTNLAEQIELQLKQRES